MIEKVAHVRNPLTVIAIFAGLAEVSGTVVLPLLEKSTQEIYVWFLMSFPCLLILLFFGTLLARHHVLYAPADYKNEQLFADTFRPATMIAREAKIEEESVAVVESGGVGKGSAPLIPDAASGGTQESVVHEEVEVSVPVPSRARKLAKGLIAETVAVQHLSDEFQMPFVQNVSVEGVPDFSFDAVGHSGELQVIAEVLSSTLIRVPAIVKNRLRVFRKLWNTLPSERRQKTYFIFAVVLADDEADDRSLIMRELQRYFSDLPFFVLVRFYDFPKRLLEGLEN